jgi:hypothetical protein
MLNKITRIGACKEWDFGMTKIMHKEF